MKKSEFNEFLEILNLTSSEFYECLASEQDPPEEWCKSTCPYDEHKTECNYACWEKYLDIALEKDEVKK